jgi:hypothetical protein
LYYFLLISDHLLISFLTSLLIMLFDFYFSSVNFLQIFFFNYLLHSFILIISHKSILLFFLKTFWWIILKPFCYDFFINVQNLEILFLIYLLSWILILYFLLNALAIRNICLRRSSTQLSKNFSLLPSDLLAGSNQTIQNSK